MPTPLSLFASYGGTAWSVMSFMQDPWVQQVFWDDLFPFSFIDLYQNLLYVKYK